jgi:hypothetical protein
MNHDRECSAQPSDALRRNQRLAFVGEFAWKPVGELPGLQRHHCRGFDRRAHPVGSRRGKCGSQHDCNSRRIPRLEPQPRDMPDAETTVGHSLAARRVVTGHNALPCWA